MELDRQALLFVLVILLFAAIFGCLGVILFSVFAVGAVMLWRRQEPITPRGAVRAGAEEVSRVFVRTREGLVPRDEAETRER